MRSYKRIIFDSDYIDVLFNNRMVKDKILLIYTIVLSFVIFLAVIGPEITPYGYNEVLYTQDGGLLRAEPPSLEHPLGTTNRGQDVLSRVMYGARPTVITGFIGGAIVVGVGGTIGITSGYYGGKYDDFCMRIVDLMYGVPILPFAIVLIAFIDIGFYQSILILSLLLWRGPARTLRSQTLQIREQPFIRSAKATGASDFRIILKYIFPNIAPMSILFFTVGIALVIVIQASLAFLGFVDPFVPSWGLMLRNAYDTGYLSQALWWSLPPGILLSITVLSAFMFGRRFVRVEQNTDNVPLAEA